MCLTPLVVREIYVRSVNGYDAGHMAIAGTHKVRIRARCRDNISIPIQT